MLEAEARASVEKATAEWVESMRARPDDGHSHYNLGNLHLSRGETRRAVEEYHIATRLSPDFVPPFVNLANALAVLGDPGGVEKALRRALEIEPNSAAASFNLGLLLGEQGRLEEAKKAHRAALEADPALAAAAYNLGVILAGEDMTEALLWCRRAAELRPDEPRYAYTLAFFVQQAGDAEGAVTLLESLIDTHPGYGDAWALLGTLYERLGRADDARALYRRAVENDRLPTNVRRQFALRLSSPR
jgi:tetratricopeptide (TPR) repeat protein